MAENRNITYNLTYKIDSKVTTPAKLILQSDDLKHGKWQTSPPNQITTTPGNSTTKTFKASGRSCAALGTEGSVVYKGTDAENTEFTLSFAIPYSKANDGSLTGGSSYYDTFGGNVPSSGNSVTVDVEIKQIKPTI